MPPPATLTTIHHVGGGRPDDGTGYAHGGYTYGIGVTRWHHFRTVWQSFATLGFNRGASLDICLSGNRMEHNVTANDVDLIRAAVTDARTRGYVVANPTVRAHRNSPGSSTVCPGDRTMAVWAQIVAACTAGGPAPPPAPPPPDTGGALLTTVVSPQRGNPQGRIPTARPIPAFGVVALENGASVDGDQAAGSGQRVLVNNDPVVVNNRAQLIDIAPVPNGFVELRALPGGQIGTYVRRWRT